MSHNKIFSVFYQVRAFLYLKDPNQRYKLLKTKSKDIFITASCQNIADFVYSAYKIWGQI